MATSTATILFADVAGSTELRAHIGEAAADKLFVDLERRLTAAVERRGGRVLKTAGDGVMAAFESASEAVNAGVDMQRGAERREDGVKLYVGIASGDVSWEGNDCFGLPVITAARLESRAEPGQILVSQIVRLLAGERAGATFTSVGPLELKGLPEPVESYAVTWEPLSEEDALESVPLPAVLATPAAFPFVSRRAEWETLEDAWAAVKAGGRRVVLIGGEAGGGKTRLASEFARTCHDDGGAVLFGGCDAELVIPYQPWVQALDHLFRTINPADIDPDVAADLAVLAPLLPTLERRSQPTPPVGGDADTERYRLFAAVHALFAEASRRWPVVVVLDDLHWASAQTWALLAHLARASAQSRVLLIGTFRDVGEDLNDTLSSALADLRRADNATRVRLHGLDAAAVADLVSKTTGHELDASMRQLVSEVTTRTLGNAFFVGEMWHHLVATGVVNRRGDKWTTMGAPLDASGVPDSIREVVAERLARLPFAVRRLAELVAVGGQRLEHRVVAAATDLVPAELTNALDALTTAALLEAVERPLLAYQFTHALVRNAVEYGIPVTTRAQMHLRIAEALEAAHEGDPRAVLAELARHYTGAAGLGVAPKAVYYCRRAAEQAIASIAYEDALDHLNRALELTPDASVARAEVLLDISDAHARLSQFTASALAAEEAFHLAREHKLPQLAADAAVAYGEATHIPGLPGGHTITIASEAIRLLGDGEGATRARLEATLATALDHSGRRAEAEVARDNALRLSHGQDHRTRSLALQAAMTIEQDPEHLLEWAKEAEQVADVTGDKWSLAYATTSYLRALVTLGRLDEMHPVLERHAEVAQQIWIVTGLLEEYCYRLIVALARGAFAEAEAAAENLSELGGDHPAKAGMYGLQMFAIRREQGRLDEAAPILELASRQEDQSRLWGPGLAMLYVEVGQLDKARRAFDRLAADEFASVPRDSLWPATGSFLGEVCVALGDERHAGVLYRDLARFADLNLMVAMTVCLGPADRVLGGLAALLGDHPRAEQHYEAAAAVAERSSSPVWLARVHHDWARYSAARGDVARAGELADTALATAERLGMKRLAQQCREIPRVPQLAVVPDYPDGLSAREIEVLKAVAAGCSNREIGERLMISGNTAANHVRAILQKTGCANRAEAAAYAARLALLD